jgi:hypothetical protein
MALGPNDVRTGERYVLELKSGGTERVVARGVTPDGLVEVEGRGVGQTVVEPVRLRRA